MKRIGEQTRRAHLEDIASGTRRYGATRVTRQLMNELWPHPEPCPLLDFALIAGGHRPRSGQRQLIEIFAEQNGFELHYDPAAGDYVDFVLPLRPKL